MNKTLAAMTALAAMTQVAQAADHRQECMEQAQQRAEDFYTPTTTDRVVQHGIGIVSGLLTGRNIEHRAEYGARSVVHGAARDKMNKERMVSREFNQCMRQKDREERGR